MKISEYVIKVANEGKQRAAPFNLLENKTVSGEPVDSDENFIPFEFIDFDKKYKRIIKD
ncbi:MAG: hypothetical protein KKF48_01490 [Nanoarchaeota archaeon]|nr:hypothetical protein [Nanoarchaeota archaeon]MBU1027695.1 hypothetical protein [Nanoarchaeota archaeon]